MCVGELSSKTMSVNCLVMNCLVPLGRTNVTLNFGICKNLHNTIYNFSQNSRTSDNDQILIARVGKIKGASVSCER